MTGSRHSRCVNRAGAPYLWEWYRDGVARTVDTELDNCLNDCCTTQSEYEMRQAEVRQRMRRAEQGALAQDSSELGPISQHPTIWEMRWQWDGGSTPLRLYHAEPAHRPELLLALHFHVKSVVGGYAEVTAAQNAEISIAVTRFDTWSRQA